MTTDIDSRHLPPTMGEELFRFVPTLSESEAVARRRGHDAFADQLAALIKLLTSNPIATNRTWVLPDAWETVPRTIGMDKRAIRAVISDLSSRSPSDHYGQLWHPAGLCVESDVFQKTVTVTNLDTRDKLATIFRIDKGLNPPFWPTPLTQGVSLAEWIPYVEAIGEIFPSASDDQCLIWELLDLMNTKQIAATRVLEPPPCWWVVPKVIPLGPERLRHIAATVKHLRDKDGITITFGVDDGHAYLDGSHFSVTPHRHVPAPLDEDEVADYNASMEDYGAAQSQGNFSDEDDF